MDDRASETVSEPLSDTPKGSFPKSAHLRKHSDFQRVYQQGRRHFSGNMTVFYLRAEAPSGIARDEAGSAAGSSEPALQPGPERIAGQVRIGFTCSKALGGAVERNRMRRRTREAVRHHLRMLDDVPCSVDVVINPKKSLLGAEFPQISQEIERAFGVIRRNCEQSCERCAKVDAPRSESRRARAK